MIRLFAVLFVACALYVSQSCSGPVYGQSVQDDLLQKLRAHTDVASATLQEEGVIYVLMKGESEPRIVSTLQIDQLKRNGALADSVLDSFVATVTASRDVVEAIPELSSARPVVRSKSTLDGFEQQLATSDKPTALIRYPLVADIEIGFAFQTAGGMRYATQDDLKGLKLTETAFAEVAMRNFDEVTRETQWSNSGGALIAQLDGTYESSLLLIDNLWPEIEKALGGPIVVGVPARDSLIAVRADDSDQVTELRRAMNNEYAYPISSKLLSRKDGRWIEFE